MATCPKCGGYSGKTHRCWGGRRRWRSVGLTLIGAGLGLGIPWLIVEHPTLPLLVVTAMLGSVLTVAVRRNAGF